MQYCRPKSDFTNGRISRKPPLKRRASLYGGGPCTSTEYGGRPQAFTIGRRCLQPASDRPSTIMAEAPVLLPSTAGGPKLLPLARAARRASLPPRRCCAECIVDIGRRHAGSRRGWGCRSRGRARVPADAQADRMSAQWYSERNDAWGARSRAAVTQRCGLTQSPAAAICSHTFTVLVVARLEEEVVDLAEQKVQDACGHARAPHQRQRARPGVARTPAEVEGGRRGAPEIEAGLRTGSLKVECAAERTY